MSETEGFPPAAAAGPPVDLPDAPVASEPAVQVPDLPPAAPEPPPAQSAPSAESGAAPPSADEIPDGTAVWLRRILEHLLGK